MASLSALVHAVFVYPSVWIAARFLTGFSLIGIFIIVESWLNDRANNKTRGQVLSLYMFIIFTVGVLSWLIYGISITDLPLILANAITLIFSLFILIYKIKYK